MDLLSNPFHILGATPSDNRRRLADLVEERSLAPDADACREARAALTNPRRRLAAEVAWLPGISDSRRSELVQMVKVEPAKAFHITDLPPLPLANVMASALTRMTRMWEGSLFAKSANKLAAAVDAVDTGSVADEINAERMQAEFQIIGEDHVLEEALQAQTEWYAGVLRDSLDRMPSRELVRCLTLAVNESTEKGQRHGLPLLHTLVDRYEVEAQEFLNLEKANVQVLSSRVRKAAMQERASLEIEAEIGYLEHVLRNWDMVAQPIQMSRMIRGERHPASKEVADSVASLITELAYKHGKVPQARRLNQILIEVFAEVRTVIEWTGETARTLEKLERSQRLH